MCFPLPVILSTGTVLLCMAMNYNQICYSDFRRRNLVSLSVKQNLLPCLLTSPVCFLLQDVWLRGEADGQRYGERVSPVCRDGPRAASCGHCQLYQQSHAGTTATQMREQENLKTLDCWGSGGDVKMILTCVLMKCVCVYLHFCLHLYRWHHCAWLYDCFYNRI